MKRMTPAIGSFSAGSAKDEAGTLCSMHRAAAMKAVLLSLERKAKEGVPRNDDEWLVARTEVAKWVNKLIKKFCGNTQAGCKCDT